MTSQIGKLTSRLRHLEGVEEELRRKEEILSGTRCCFCRRRRIHARLSSKQIGEMCVQCHEVVKESNDQIDVGEGKAFLAKYGSVGDFYNGLDRYSGRPLCGGANQILKEMQEECAGLLTGAEEICTSNYGQVTTTVALEWEFVFNPDLHRPYPGSDIVDGHRCGKPMIDHATGEQLKDAAGNPRFWPGRVPEPLSKFMNHPMARKAGMSKPEVLALRLYTGPCYAKLNTLLRSGSAYLAQERQAGRNTFTTTISAINSGIRKLLECSAAEPEAAVLFRGTGNMKLPPDVLRGTCNSFVECGFSSATPRREVALQYSGSKDSALFEIETGVIDRGATLDWVSQYPSEEEHVILPLSNFEIVGMRQDTKANVIWQTQQLLDEQIIGYHARLREERKQRSESTIAAVFRRHSSCALYRVYLGAAQVVQARLRAVLRSDGSRQMSRPEAYQHTSALDSTPAEEPAALGEVPLSREARLQLERNRELDEQREATECKERHLESRLKCFFETLAPGSASKGQVEEVLFKTGNADPQLSREARINLLLREMQALGGRRLCIDLTSNATERGIRRKIIEAECRREELERACKSGWARAALESRQLINIYQIRLNVNLQAQTIEQLRETRKTTVLDFARSLLQESRAYLRGVLSLERIQDLEHRLLAPFEEKHFDFYNVDIENYRTCINEVFALWQAQLCDSVVEMRGKGQQALDKSEQEHVSAEEKDRAMKLLARAIQIAEAAAGSEATEHLSAMKQILFDMTETAGTRPEKDQSTALLQQAGMLLFPAHVQQHEARSQGASESVAEVECRHPSPTSLPSPSTPPPSTFPFHSLFLTSTSWQAMGFAFKALKIRRDLYATPKYNLSETKALLEELRCSYSLAGLRWQRLTRKPEEGRERSNSKLAQALADKLEFLQHEWAAFGINDLQQGDFILSGDSYFTPCEAPDLQKPGQGDHPVLREDVIMVRERAFDLLTFLHPEIRSSQGGDRGAGQTSVLVCMLVKALLSLGVATFVDLGTYVTTDDIASMKIPQDLAGDFKALLDRMAERQSRQDAHQEDEFVEVRDAQHACMDVPEANRVFLASASHDLSRDTIGRIICHDGMARMMWEPAFSLVKLAGLLQEGAAGSLPFPVLDQALVAFGLMLAGNQPLVLNDQGNACMLEAGTCVCSIKGCCHLQQCASCTRLQGDVERFLIPVQHREQHMAHIIGTATVVVLKDCVTSLVRLMENSQSPSLQANSAYAIHNLACMGLDFDFKDSVTRLTAAMEEHKWESHVQACAMQALVALLRNPVLPGTEAKADWNQKLDGLVTPHNLEPEQICRIIQEVTEVLMVHRRSLGLQLLGCRCLYYLSCIDGVRADVIKGWGVEALVRCMNSSKIGKDDATLIQNYCCSALHQLAHDANSCKRIVVVGGVTALVNALHTVSSANEVTVPLEALLALSHDARGVEAKILAEAVVVDVYGIIHERSCFEAHHHAVICETIHALAGSNSHARNFMMASGVKDDVERSRTKYIQDAAVQNWALKCLMVLKPDPSGSACCSMQ